MVEAGKVFLPESAEWLADFLDELSSFPSAPHDDCVDALSQALNYARTTEPAMFVYYRTLLKRQSNGEPEVRVEESNRLTDRYLEICKKFSTEDGYICPACSNPFTHEPHPHRREGAHRQVDCSNCGRNLQWDEPEPGGALTPCVHVDRAIPGALVPSRNLANDTDTTTSTVASRSVDWFNQRFNVSRRGLR